MNLRTVVRDGLIVINTHGEIPDGTPVEVVRLTPDKKKIAAKKKGAKKAARKSKGTGSSRKIPDFAGIWENRPEWEGKSSAEIALELRQKALRGSRNA